MVKRNKLIRLQTLASLPLVFFSTIFSMIVYADVPAHPEVSGPYLLKTVKFPQLRDSTRDNRSVPVKIHLPAEKGRWPVVIFSHGAGGNRDANIGQARHLASYGYAVFCLEHIGSNTEVMKRSFRWLQNVKAMTRDAAEVINRPKDVSFAIDQAFQWNRSHAELVGQLDTSRIGVAGHSFGSYTTLAALGVRPALDWLVPKTGAGKGLGPDLSDARITAGVALSPQGPGEPFFIESSYRSLQRPVLGITGSRDKPQNGEPESRRRFFGVIPPGNHVYIWLNNADHMAFSDSSETGKRGFRSRSRKDVQPIVRAATLLFFEGHLRGNAAALAALNEQTFKPLLGKVVDGLEIHKK